MANIDNKKIEQLKSDILGGQEQKQQETTPGISKDKMDLLSKKLGLKEESKPFEIELPSSLEKEFQEDFKEYAEELGINKNPDAPEHKYDYREYWKDKGHLPRTWEPKTELEEYEKPMQDEKKFTIHPNAFQSETKTRLQRIKNKMHEQKKIPELESKERKEIKRDIKEKEKVEVPDKYVDILNNAAKENDLDPGLLASLIDQESGWDPTIGNTEGENSWGLGQINLNAHESVTQEQAINPKFAIPWAAKRLRRQIDKYGLFEGVQAYNKPGAIGSDELKEYAHNILSYHTKGNINYNPRGKIEKDNWLNKVGDFMSDINEEILSIQTPESIEENLDPTLRKRLREIDVENPEQFQKLDQDKRTMLLTRNTLKKRDQLNKYIDTVIEKADLNKEQAKEYKEFFKDYKPTYDFNESTAQDVLDAGRLQFYNMIQNYKKGKARKKKDQVYMQVSEDEWNFVKDTPNIASIMAPIKATPYVWKLPGEILAGIPDAKRIHNIENAIDEGMTREEFNEKQKAKQETFAKKYNEITDNTKKWIREHPELRPPEDVSTTLSDAIKNNRTDLLLNPNYWAYQMLSNQAFTMSGMAATSVGAIGGGLIAGPPGAIIGGLITGTAAMKEFEGEEVYQQLIDANVDPEKASRVTTAVKTNIALLESSGDLLELATMGGGKLVKNFLNKSAKKTVNNLIKKGFVKRLAKGAAILGTEGFEEASQDAYKQAILETFGAVEKMDLDEKAIEALKTVIDTVPHMLPYAIIGMAGDTNIDKNNILQKTYEIRHDIYLVTSSLPNQKELLGIDPIADHNQNSVSESVKKDLRIGDYKDSPITGAEGIVARKILQKQKAKQNMIDELNEKINGDISLKVDTNKGFETKEQFQNDLSEKQESERNGKVQALLGETLVKPKKIPDLNKKETKEELEKAKKANEEFKDKFNTKKDARFIKPVLDQLQDRYNKLRNIDFDKEHSSNSSLELQNSDSEKVKNNIKNNFIVDLGKKLTDKVGNIQEGLKQTINSLGGSEIFTFGGYKKGIFSDDYMLIDNPEIAQNIYESVVEQEARDDARDNDSYTESQLLKIKKKKFKNKNLQNAYPDNNTKVTKKKGTDAELTGHFTNNKGNQITVFATQDGKYTSVDSNRLAFLLDFMPDDIKFAIQGNGYLQFINQDGEILGLLTPKKNTIVPETLTSLSDVKSIHQEQQKEFSLKEVEAERTMENLNELKNDESRSNEEILNELQEVQNVYKANEIKNKKAQEVNRLVQVFKELVKMEESTKETAKEEAVEETEEVEEEKISDRDKLAIETKAREKTDKKLLEGKINKDEFSEAFKEETKQLQKDYKLKNYDSYVKQIKKEMEEKNTKEIESFNDDNYRQSIRKTSPDEENPDITLRNDKGMYPESEVDEDFYDIVNEDPYTKINEENTQSNGRADFQATSEISTNKKRQIIAEISNKNKNETAWVAFLDENNNLLGVENIGIGDTEKVTPDKTHMMEKANNIDGDVSSAVLVHFHKSHIPEPSQQDKQNTRKLADYLAKNGINLKGHIVLDTYHFGFLSKTDNFNTAYYNTIDETPTQTTPQGKVSVNELAGFTQSLSNNRKPSLLLIDTKNGSIKNIVYLGEGFGNKSVTEFGAFIKNAISNYNMENVTLVAVKKDLLSQDNAEFANKIAYQNPEISDIVVAGVGNQITSFKDENLFKADEDYLADNTRDFEITPKHLKVMQLYNKKKAIPGKLKKQRDQLENAGMIKLGDITKAQIKELHKNDKYKNNKQYRKKALKPYKRNNKSVKSSIYLSKGEAAELLKEINGEKSLEKAREESRKEFEKDLNKAPKGKTTKETEGLDFSSEELTLPETILKTVKRTPAGAQSFFMKTWKNLGSKFKALSFIVSKLGSSDNKVIERNFVAEKRKGENAISHLRKKYEEWIKDFDKWVKSGKKKHKKLGVSPAKAAQLQTAAFIDKILHSKKGIPTINDFLGLDKKGNRDKSKHKIAYNKKEAKWLQDMARTMKEINKTAFELDQKYNLGTEKRVPYFPVIWDLKKSKVDNANKKIQENVYGMKDITKANQENKYKRLNNNMFAKKKTITNIYDAVQAGFRLSELNPLRMALKRLEYSYNIGAKMEAIGKLKDNDVIFETDYKENEDGDVVTPAEDNINENTDFQARKAELENKINNETDSWTVEKSKERLNRLKERDYKTFKTPDGKSYWIPSDLYRKLKNMAKNSWWKSRGWKMAFHYAMLAKNTFIGILLAGSMFHALEIGLMSTGGFLLGSSIFLAAKLDIKSAIKTIARIPFQFVSNWIEGKKIFKILHKDPGELTADEARLRMIIEESGIRGRLPEERGGKIRANFMKALRQGNIAKSVGLSIPAFFRLLSAPLMEKFVPYSKLAMTAKIGTFQLVNVRERIQKLNKNRKEGNKIEFTEQKRREELYDVGETVHNFFGELPMDTLPWNPITKATFLFSTFSLGWVFGITRGTIKGAGDVVKAGRNWQKRTKNSPIGEKIKDIDSRDFTIATQELMGYIVFTILVNSLIQLLASGEPPEEIRDVLQPKTGKVNPDGTPERIQLPSQTKEYVNIYDDVRQKGILGGTFEYFSNKQNPLIGAFVRGAKNETWDQRNIVNPDDDTMEKATHISNWIRSQLNPIVLQEYHKRKRASSSPWLAFTGVRTIKTYIPDTTVEAHIIESYADRFKITERVEAKTEREAFRFIKANWRAAVEAAKSGNKKETEKFSKKTMQQIKAGIDGGLITRKKAISTLKNIDLNSAQLCFKGLPAEEQEYWLYEMSPKKRNEFIKPSILKVETGRRYLYKILTENGAQFSDDEFKVINNMSKKKAIKKIRKIHKGDKQDVIDIMPF